MMNKQGSEHRYSIPISLSMESNPLNERAAKHYFSPGGRGGNELCQSPELLDPEEAVGKGG